MRNVIDFEFRDAISITPDNFYTGSWAKGFSRVKLHDCLITIPPRTFRSIQHLCFSAHTSFRNIRTMLECCPCLRTLCFQDVILDQVAPYAGSEYPDCYIQQLWFHNTQPLGTNEYWLMDFFTHSVKFASLSSFHFRMEVGSPCPPGSTLDSNSDRLPEFNPPDPAILAKFIIQNGDKLQDVVLGGNGFTISGLTLEEMSEFSKVHLQYMLFSMDTDGMDILLENQDSLKYLTCKGSFTDRVNWRVVSRLFKCFRRNASTLQSIAVYSLSPMDEVSKDLTLAQCTYDGAQFSNFPELRSLMLAMVFESRTTGRSFGCRFKNLHLLPRTLREIHIVVEEFLRSEFDLLGSKIVEFSKLERFNFTATAPASYTVKLDWIKGFKELKNFVEAEFCNADVKKSQILGMEILLLNETVDSPKIEMEKLGNLIRFSRVLESENESKTRPTSRA